MMRDLGVNIRMDNFGIHFQADDASFMPCKRLIAGCLYQIQQHRSCIPVPDGHALVHGHAGDPIQVALGCFAGQPRKIEHALSGKGFVHSLLEGDAFHCFFCCKRLLEKKDIVAVEGRLAAEALGRMRDNFFQLLVGSKYHA